MPILSNSNALPGSASIVLRLGEGLDGHRLVTDDAVTLCVHALPFAEMARAAASAVLSVPAAYVLAGDRQNEVYVGETGNLARRLQEHALDATKSFAVEVFALVDLDGRLDKPSVVHLQKRLSEVIRSAEAARLIAGVSPCSADLPRWRRITLDRMFDSALPLLVDAGCRCVLARRLAPKEAQETIVSDTSCRPLEAASAMVDDEGDEGPMEIGVTVVPLGVEEMTLSFCNLWARGYDYQNGFVVAAGSEMRQITNPSANAHTVARRQRLVGTGTALPVDGLGDRLRLKVAVWFPSRAIAAKVLCGAHVGSEKWKALDAERPCVITT